MGYYEEGGNTELCQATCRFLLDEQEQKRWCKVRDEKGKRQSNDLEVFLWL